MKALRWSSVKQNKRKSLLKLINFEKYFNFRPYTFTPRGAVDVKLYVTLGGGFVDIAADEMPMDVLTWIAIVSQTSSIHCKIKSGNS